ncbi:MAG: MATE family efflux transporter [Clostridiales bacterium]|nr:MATE family efflux transporter [Clostridiales bacterium]
MAETAKKVGRDLTTGSLTKGIFLFVGPVILTNLIQQVYSMVDLMVIGKFVGNVGTVGVSTGGEIADFLTPVATAFALAGQVYIAQLAGAKKFDALKESVGSFLSLMMGMSIFFAVVSIVFCNQFLAILNCPQEALQSARAYMIITSIGYPFIFGYNAVCGVLRGMGESKRPLIFIIVAAIANIFLDLLLVVIFKLDAAGTAIATAASQLASFVAAFLYMYRIRDAIGFQLKLSYFKMKKEPTMIILRLGVPQAVRSVLVRVSILWVNASVNSYGLVASGTNSVGNKLQKFLEIFSSSISQAGGAAIGQNLGAEKHDRAKKVVYIELVSTLAVAAIISLMVFLFPKAFFGIFTDDVDVLEMGVTYLNIMIIHFFVSAVVSSYQSMVVGSGNAALNFIIGILDGVVCKIGLSILFATVWSMGVYGYFWGTALSRILPAAACMAYFYSGKWKGATLLKKKD